MSVAKMIMIRSLIDAVDYPLIDRIDDILELVTSMTEAEDRSLMLEEISISLAKRGSYEKAFELLQQIEGEYEKAEELIKIAEILIADNQSDRAKPVLKEAEALSHLIKNKWQVADLLARIAEAFISLSSKNTAIRILDEAVFIAREGEKSADQGDSLDSSSALWDISITFFKLGERDKAIEVAEGISNEGKRKRAIETILELNPNIINEKNKKKFLVSQELINDIRSFPLIRNIHHCGEVLSISPFDIYVTCHKCGQKIKVRSMSATSELEDVFDAVFEWLLQPGATPLMKRRQEIIRAEME